MVCCLFENSMLGKLLMNFLTDLPRVAYKIIAYKKNTCICI